ncbi:peroxisomal membrane protein PMP22-like [Lolium rigidum]|uniref:peroxisomal membrane protein PMP22-like n=1 Tax=Lolium rigidum TaxID=89674 RepID=UPI001F5C9301|nr:peroxisomal membrane protein PMP22-like [Lolium rigidum]
MPDSLQAARYSIVPAVGHHRRPEHFNTHDRPTTLRVSEREAMAGEAYMRQLRAHPLLTKAVTSGVLAGCSDAIAQKIAGARKLQLRRLLVITLYGFAYAGPFGHFFHKLMDRIFKGKKGRETAANKVIVEQLTASPLNNLLFMIYYGLVVEGRPSEQVKSKIKKEYANIQLTSWKLRPIVSWINYEYVPLQHRVLFASSVASCWAVFLNLKAARSSSLPATSKNA